MPIARQLDMLVGDGIEDPPTLNQMVWANVADFFRYCETNGLCTVVASNYGASGTGEDYYDGANPAGENAFIYAEWNTGMGQLFGVLAQYADAAVFGQSPGNPGQIDGGTIDGVAFAMAVRDDGTSPWAGTTNDDGSDTKGATVWTPGSSSVRTFPRANGVGGDEVINKEQMTRFVDQQATNSRGRYHFVANANGLLLLGDIDNNSTYTQIFMGRYTPRAGLSALLTTPYMMMRDSGITGWFFRGTSNVYGDLTGAGARNGALVALPADDVMQFSVSLVTAGQDNTFYQPSALITPNEFEPAPAAVFAHESGKTGDFGLAGFLDSEIVAAIYNATSHQTNAAGTLAYAGTTVLAALKHAISWDAGAAPGNGVTRAGRQSFSA